jgi:hypothetical protein
VALGLRCEAVNQSSRQQSTYGGDDWYQPQSMRTDDFFKNSTLSRESRRMVTGQPKKEELLREPQSPNK